MIKIGDVYRKLLAHYDVPEGHVFVTVQCPFLATLDMEETPGGKLMVRKRYKHANGRKADIY